MTKLRWRRRLADSTSNFDLVLENPTELDRSRMLALLDSITNESHRGLTLNGRAVVELKRFFHHPETPLKSFAYVLLSNWFLTASGDRNSMVASGCEAMWDELFPARPLERLSSPTAGQNHLILVSEFQSFWSRVCKAQRDDAGPSSHNTPAPIVPVLPAQQPQPADEDSDSGHLVRADFVKQGLHFHVKGSPTAMAEFLRSME